MDMKRVYSSHINSIGYDPATKELHVEFDNKKIGVYMDVPPDVAVLVTDAPSVGTALHAYVKGKFAFGYKS